jgi:superkiller protein 3
MSTLTRNPLFYWPVAVTLARGIGLLLSWLWREIHEVGWTAWARGATLALSLGYVYYLLSGLTRAYFAILWWASGAAVAGVTAMQLSALAAIRRWADEHKATVTLLLVGVGVCVPGGGARAQAIAATLYQCQHLPNGAHTVTTCRQVASIDPTSLRARLALGRVLAEQGSTENAADEFRAAVTIDSTSAAAQYGLAAALSQLGRDTESVAHFRAAVRLKPTYVDAVRGLARALNVSGHPDQAIPIARDLIAMTPGEVDGYYSLTYALGRVGRLNEALHALEAAQEIAPRDPSVRIDIGGTLQRLGRWADALTAFQGAIQLAPDRADAWGGMAVTSAQLGRYADAVTEWNRARTIDTKYFDTRIPERAAYERSVAIAGTQPPASVVNAP